MDTAKLQELLEVENNNLFAECVCSSTGLPAWPTIRNHFFRLVMSDWFKSPHPQVGIHSIPKMFHVGKGVVRASLHNFTHPPWRSSVLIYATGAGLYSQNGFSRNHYTHYFSEALGNDSWSIEGLFEYVWPPPREGGRLSYSLPGLAAIELYSRVTANVAVRRMAEKVVEGAKRRAKRLFGWSLGDAQKEWLVTHCARKVTGYPLEKVWMTRWLDQVRPRLLLVEEGCYGHMAAVNATARECGVAVAEYQHGLVTGGHDVYNVAPVLERSEAYRRTLPEYFLGYGAWWNRQFNAPTRKVVIGNPHRAAFMDRQVPVKKEQGMILVLGDGFETDSYLDFCRRLGSLLPMGCRVVFRPHPLERSRVLASPCGVAKEFQIDQEPDIYPSLAKADVVVAELSTGLFEAVGLARMIFVWNTPKSRFSLPSHPFASFDTVTDLARMIQGDSGAGVFSGVASEEIWASDWRERFRDFINGIGDRGSSRIEKEDPSAAHEG